MVSMMEALLREAWADKKAGGQLGSKLGCSLTDVTVASDHACFGASNLGAAGC